MVTRKLVLVLVTFAAVILLLDAGWAVCARLFGWYHGHGIFFLSLATYLTAGFVAYDCGGRILSAVAGAVVSIVDNSLGTLITWLILPTPVAQRLPSIPEMAPMFAESVLVALVLGFVGGLVAAMRHHWQERRRLPT